MLFRLELRGKGYKENPSLVENKVLLLFFSISFLFIYFLALYRFT